LIAARSWAEALANSGTDVGCVIADKVGASLVPVMVTSICLVIRPPCWSSSVMLKLSTYRKLEPGGLEESIFYDHPSGRTRIAAAMRWKKEHIADPDIRDTAKIP